MAEIEQKTAIDRAAKVAKDALTPATTSTTVSTDLSYAFLDDDLSRDMLDSHTPFLFLVDINTGDGLLCEYKQGTSAVTPGNYRQLHLAASDVKVLRKSTGIVPDYLNLPRDMVQRPEGVMTNLATLSMLKLVNLFDEVNATSESEQKDMLARFIKERTGKTVIVSTSDEAESTASKPPTSQPTKTVIQFSAEEDIVRRLFENTKGESAEFNVAIGMLNKDVFLYTWENRYNYVPQIITSKGTAFKKGTIVLRVLKDDSYSKVTVIDMSDNIYADESFAVKDSAFFNDKVSAEHLLRVSENAQFAASESDIDYVTNIENPRIRYNIISRLFSKQNELTRGIVEWKRVLDSIREINEKFKIEAQATAEEEKLLKKEYEALRQKFESKLEEETQKFGKLLARLRERNNQSEEAFVYYGRMKMPITWNDGNLGTVNAGTRILIVQRQEIPDVIDEEAEESKIMSYVASDEKVVGTRTWYSIFFLDRRAGFVNNKFAANYSKLTIPYEKGSSRPKKTASALQPQPGFLRSVVGALAAMNTDDEDIDDPTATFRAQLTSLEDLSSQEFTEEIISYAKNGVSKLSKEVLAVNPAAFADYVGVMTAKELKDYRGGQNEYFGGYMNGIDFANFVLDAEINYKGKAIRKAEEKEQFKKDREKGGKVYNARQTNLEKFKQLVTEFENRRNFVRSSATFKLNGKRFPRLAVVETDDARVYSLKNQNSALPGLFSGENVTMKKGTRVLLGRPMRSTKLWNRITVGDMCRCIMLDQREKTYDIRLKYSTSRDHGVFAIKCSDLKEDALTKPRPVEDSFVDMLALQPLKFAWLADVPDDEFPLKAVIKASGLKFLNEKPPADATNYLKTLIGSKNKASEMATMPSGENEQYYDGLQLWEMFLEDQKKWSKSEDGQAFIQKVQEAKKKKQDVVEQNASDAVASDVVGDEEKEDDSSKSAPEADKESAALPKDENTGVKPKPEDWTTTFLYKNEYVTAVRNGEKITLRKENGSEETLSLEEAKANNLQYWSDSLNKWMSMNQQTMRISIQEDTVEETIGVDE